MIINYNNYDYWNNFYFCSLFQLGKLTVAVLKDLIKQAKITTSATKKADLIEAINDHFGV